MEDLTNITVRQLYRLNEDTFNEYMSLKKMLKGKNVFNKKQAIAIGALTYSEVSQIKRIFIAPTIDGIFHAFESIFKTTKDKVLQSDVISFFYALNFISESIDKILKNERKVLFPEVTEDTHILEQAGIARLEVFQELPGLINLAQQFSTSPQVIETWKYNLVFSIMAYNKVLSEIQKKHGELKSSYASNTGT